LKLVKAREDGADQRHTETIRLGSIEARELSFIEARGCRVPRQAVPVTPRRCVSALLKLLLNDSPHLLETGQAAYVDPRGASEAQHLESYIHPNPKLRTVRIRVCVIRSGEVAGLDHTKKILDLAGTFLG
jgi:hypothetical protein